MSNLLRLVVSFATVDRLSGSLKGIVGLAQTGGEKLAGMKRHARDLERELTGVRAQIAGTSGNVTGLFAQEADLQAQIARTNREMQEQVRLLRISNQVERMQARGAALRSSGQQQMIGGAMMLAPAILAVKGIGDFQSGMTDIALKAELSQNETAELQRNILAAARAARQLPENMRAGVDTLAGFGMTPQQAVQMIGPIGRVATAYKASVDDLAAASFANFSNLKVPINENAKALEAMTAAGNAGAFEIKDMAQYFPMLTAQAQAFGQQGVGAVADLAAAAQIARKGTGDAASAATNLQNLMAKINTKETIDKFQKMGVDLPAALKKAYADGKTPLEAIAEITNTTLGGKLDRISFLFGDMQAQQALRPLIQNMEEYRRIRAEAMASSGAIDASFNRRMGDMNAQIPAIIGNLQTMALTLGPVLLPSIVRITEAAARLTDRIAAWAEANPGMAASLVGIVVGIGALRIGVGALMWLFGAFLGPAAGVYGFFARNGQAIVTMLGLLRTGFLLLGRGIVSAGAMMLANPVVLIIVGIVAAVGGAAYLIYRYWDQIKAAFWAGVAAVKGALSAGWTWIKANFSPAMLLGIFNPIGGMIVAGLIAGFKAMFPRAYAEVTGFLGSLVTGAKKLLGIHSPSRVFMGLGSNIAAGLALGISQGQGAAAMAAQEMTHRVALPALEPFAPRRGGAGAGGAAQAAGGFGDVHITIQAAPGQSVQDIAQEVRRILAQIQSERDAARRSAFQDED
ncbi:MULTISPECIES: phage tail tape measure protein [Sphingobium]|uniref:phage tail tape measure protein n=1 Tax=Sphingobium TaxID=165695 RepID=UPI0015ECC4C2|nr:MULTISPECIES: phage tail tape measure protein [Sphingobium]MCW2362438.1 TP901 family phage tail tape measure protein [Sphingobium sp. B10D3B]MCW2400882.1 TP901 family phage tail tape measure protein [Sphingobium sp. B10D7B]MCW2407861.1 TP901 family phage tail tape measure protein [Sphingobium xanthum]